MTSTVGLRRVIVSVLLAGMWAASAQGQYYGGPGANWYGQAGIPYGYPFPYGYPYSVGGPSFDAYGNVYLPGYPDAVPPPIRYLAPSYSYNPNPYAPFPGAASYELPWYAYNPNSYTYDLRAYGLGYPPPPYAYPATPYYYTPYSYYIGRRPYYWRGPYRAMTLQQYNAKSLQGPTRVRDIVPGMPELGG